MNNSIFNVLKFCRRTAVLLLLWSGSVLSSEHREAAGIFTDQSVDITDFYAFLNPNDSSKLVMVICVNGFASPTSPGSFQFADEARYDFNVDITGDAKVDKLIRVQFGKPSYSGNQSLTAWFPNGYIFHGVTTATPTYSIEAPEPVINEGQDGIKVFAGLRDDPFFFDVVASFRVFSGLGTFSSAIDRFAGLNVSALVVEVPLSLVSEYPGQKLQIWSDTERKEKGEWQQVQRVGNPAVKPIFIPGDLKDKFNRTLPHLDKYLFTEAITNSVIYGLGAADHLPLILSQLIPDTIRLDPSLPIEWPNGRDLDEDTMDLMFSYNLYKPFTHAPGDLDGVHHNDVEFLTEFPYLAPPHIAP